MTTLIKTDGQYVVKPGDNLSKIASTQGITLAELLASNPEYASNPNLIHPGDVVKTSAPQLSDLAPVSSPAPVSTGTGSNKTTFTEALIKMLKEAQGQNDQGQQQLNVQKNLITGQGINDAVSNFKNPLLSPSTGGSLAMSAQRQFDPALETIAQQQQRGTENLGNIRDLIEMQQDAYDKEQNRIADAKELSSGTKLTATERYNALLASYANGFESGETMPDGTPILDPNGYINPKAWKSALANARSKGISRDDFIKQYADYLYKDNLSAYGLTPVEQAYVVKPASASSAETEAIINAILNQ